LGWNTGEGGFRGVGRCARELGGDGGRTEEHGGACKLESGGPSAGGSIEREGLRDVGGMGERLAISCVWLTSWFCWLAT
jgi:hypothetical protein